MSKIVHQNEKYNSMHEIFPKVFHITDTSEAFLNLHSVKCGDRNSFNKCSLISDKLGSYNWNMESHFRQKEF